ncbi:MAG: hemerythrin domain-containing protein [Planctomycetes bacterium]|nr:hemerythrin domain-containing protein [Planctomycetota bacterium]
MTDQLDMAVGDIALRSPGANRVLWRHGIAYGSWGQRTVRDSCQRLGIDPLQVTRDIDNIADPLAIRWQAMATPDLVRVMQVRYHEPLLSELDRLTSQARKTAIADRGRNPVLMLIAPLVARLAIELKCRISHEEQTMFPAIIAETAYAVLPPETSSDVRALPGQLLDDIRALTGGYVLREEDGDVAIRSLYIGLHMLDMDIQEHLHVENHLLFPRARSRIPS